MEAGRHLKTPMLPVGEARERLLRDAVAVGSETVPLSAAAGRVLAEDIFALRTQPPFPASAMDGYAVRAEDIESVPAQLEVTGVAAAGHPYQGTVGTGQAVRIFTGGVVPEGADTILIQENAEVVSRTKIRAMQAEERGRYVRPAGLDFREGERLLAAGTILGAGPLSLAAAGNHAQLKVRRKPVVGILATGDELLPPGSETGPGEIIASNGYGVSAIAAEAGADVIDLGIARDTTEDLSNALDSARKMGCDVLVTLGGASVGDHDLVQKAFTDKGMTLDFWRIAMRPGKPLMLGRYEDMRVLGLPGNPVSSLVCSQLFLKPLIERLAGRPSSERRQSATLAEPLGPNDQREDYLRAFAWRDADGTLRVRPFGRQDSSMIRVFAEANVLLVRPPHATASVPGEQVEIIHLDAAAL